MPKVGLKAFQTTFRRDQTLTFALLAAGAGKTVLVSTIINRIEVEKLGSVAFFYFSFQEDARSLDLWHFKCSLLVQVLKFLIVDDPSQAGWYRIPKAFHQLYKTYHPSRNPPMEAIDNTLRTLLSQSGELYFVVDGLDESPASHRQSIVKFLADLVGYPRGGCHVVVTSRREPDIEKTINGLSIEKSIVPFNIKQINEDISQHLLGMVEKEPYSRWSDQLKDKVINHLTRHADGVFRWADLQMQALAGKERDKDVEKALKRLPSDLGKTYERMLIRIENEDYSDEAIAILRWLAYAVVPLTLTQVAELAAFEAVAGGCLPDSESYSIRFNTAARFSGTRTIRSILSGLVTFTEFQESDLEADGGVVLVSFAHFSVKEYLESTGVSPMLFRLERNCCHWFILKSCLAYMRQYDADDVAARKSTPYPLLQYTCGSVLYHALELSSHLTNSEDRDQLRRLCRQLFSTKSAEEGMSLAMATRVAVECARQWPEDHMYQFILQGDLPSQPYPAAHTRLGPIHQVAALGDASSVRLMLDSGIRASEKDVYNADATALHTTARKEWRSSRAIDSSYNVLNQPAFVVDYASVVKQLIEAGCDINATDSNGSTPLEAAAAAGCNDVVQYLLGYPDVQVTSQNNEKKTPLFVAVAEGRADVVETLLKLPNPGLDVADWRGRMPLVAAAANGRDAIVKRLLADERVTPDTTDGRGRNAIFWAVEGNHKECFLILLSHPATNVGVEDDEGRNLLTVAADRGHLQILSIILDRTNLDINSRDCYGRTALSWAAFRGKAAAVEAFLTERPSTININSKDCLGRTALSWAAFHGHESVVRLLLQHNSVDSGLDDIYGMTPLLWAITRSHNSVANLLQGHQGAATSSSSESQPPGLSSFLLTDPKQRISQGTTKPEFKLAHELQMDDEVWNVEYSNDGRFLSSHGAGSEVVIWQVRSWKAVQVLRGLYAVAKASWSPDDSLLITCGRDRYAKLWDTSVGPDLIFGHSPSLKTPLTDLYCVIS